MKIKHTYTSIMIETAKEPHITHENIHIFIYNEYMKFHKRSTLYEYMHIALFIALIEYIETPTATLSQIITMFQYFINIETERMHIKALLVLIKK